MRAWWVPPTLRGYRAAWLGADALAGLTLVQSPDHCDSLPSILDLLSPTCQARDNPAGITAGDLAFLKALYFHNTGLGRTLSREEIQRNMLDQFKRGMSAETN